jgi:hypothetical protein
MIKIGNDKLKHYIKGQGAAIFGLVAVAPFVTLPWYTVGVASAIFWAIVWEAVFDLTRKFKFKPSFFGVTRNSKQEMMADIVADTVGAVVLIGAAYGIQTLL